MTTQRELDVVAEAIKKACNKCHQAINDNTAKTASEAALSASDSKYIPMLVSALKKLTYYEGYTADIARKALAQLPEDLR